MIHCMFTVSSVFFSFVWTTISSDPSRHAWRTVEARPDGKHMCVLGFLSFFFLQHWSLRKFTAHLYSNQSDM